MGLDIIYAQGNDLNTTLFKFGLKFGDTAKLSGANGSIICRVREEYYPAIISPIVEIDLTLRRLLSKIWYCIAKLKCHKLPSVISQKNIF
jgi:hypothetical protein